MTALRRVALVANSLKDTWRFRRPLVERLLAAGTDVWIIAPRDLDGDPFERIGARVRDWRLRRSSTSAVRELSALWRLVRLYREIRPDLVHQFTAKPAAYGSIAARSLRPRPVVVSQLTGLGYAFTGERPVTRRIVLSLQRAALRLSDAMLFLNTEDPRALGVSGHPKVRVIQAGEGVDVEEFSPGAVSRDDVGALRRALNLSDDTLPVVMICRILGDKGVREFAQAAPRVCAQVREARFLLVGPIDTGNPTAIRLDEVQRWERAGAVTYLGERHDVQRLLALAAIVALPSYREGMSRVLLEAAAMGRPLVATDIAGCREIVRPGVNGLLVRPRDATGLASAITELLTDEPRRRQFGEESRRIAVSEYAAGRASDAVLALYEDLWRRRRAQESKPIRARAGSRDG